jgi:hypothetical protein
VTGLLLLLGQACTRQWIRAHSMVVLWQSAMHSHSVRCAVLCGKPCLVTSRVRYAVSAGPAHRTIESTATKTSQDVGDSNKTYHGAHGQSHSHMLQSCNAWHEHTTCCITDYPQVHRQMVWMANTHLQVVVQAGKLAHGRREGWTTLDHPVSACPNRLDILHHTSQLQLPCS